MDPLDPLTEIINSGQAFPIAIAFEKIIWTIIGFFFLAAISTSITSGMQNQNWFSKNSLFHYFRINRPNDENPQSNSDEDK